MLEKEVTMFLKNASNKKGVYCLTIPYKDNNLQNYFYLITSKSENKMLENKILELYSHNSTEELSSVEVLDNGVIEPAGCYDIKTGLICEPHYFLTRCNIDNILWNKSLSAQADKLEWLAEKRYITYTNKKGKEALDLFYLAELEDVFDSISDISSAIDKVITNAILRYKSEKKGELV